MPSQATDKRSFLLPLATFLIKAIGIASPYNLIRWCAWPKKEGSEREEPPFWYTEAYVVTSLIIMIVGLVYIHDIPREPESAVHYWLVVFVVYRLIDLLIFTAMILIIDREDSSHKDESGHFLIVDNVARWVLLVMINLLEIILGFAIIYLFIGAEFETSINDSVTAIYQSALTFTTLGYGEIKPLENSLTAKTVVTLQLFYFVFFLLFKAPLIFSTVRLRELPNPPQEHGK